MRNHSDPRLTQPATLAAMLIAATALLSPTHALAWGFYAHRAVGQIAQNHVCAKALSEANLILEGESFAEAAIWPDEVRDDPAYAYLKPWHFVNISEGSSYEASPKNPKGDLVTAIRFETQMIKDSSASAPERKEALRLLIHFVGDAHQPFHAAGSDSYGGNGIRVLWFGEPESLHFVWDTGMLARLGMKSNQIAIWADTPEPPSENIPQLEAADWVNESAAIAKQVEPAHQAKGPMPELGADYQEHNIGVVRRRLREAGHRLATLLNEQFGCDPKTPAASLQEGGAR